MKAYFLLSDKGVRGVAELPIPSAASTECECGTKIIRKI